jgi:HPt (histidine-containing phosphotransfer) domain-containing protein
MSSDQRAPGPVVQRSAAATALLPRFLEHRRGDVTTIRTALTTGDFETIRRIGHNMAGNGVSYGFAEISAMGRRLEAEADARDANAVREELAELETFLARTTVQR